MDKFMSLGVSLKVISSHLFPPSPAPSTLYINATGIQNCCFGAYYLMFIPTYIKLCQLEIVFLTFIFLLLFHFIDKSQLL